MEIYALENHKSDSISTTDDTKINWEATTKRNRKEIHKHAEVEK